LSTEIQATIAAYRAGDITWDQLRTDLSDRCWEPHASYDDSAIAPGSFEEVTSAHLTGLLTDAEYTEIHAAAWKWQLGHSC
jgi:hypothetical protein